MKKVNFDIQDDIIYEDNQIIVCNKREGILSQEDDTKDPDMVNLLKDYLKVKYNKPGNVYLGLVHRLDKRVSGVMVFGKTSKASKRLSEAIREKDFEKEYLAIASGIITEAKELVDKLEKKNLKAEISGSGKESILKYFPISIIKINDKDYSILKVKLVTGRFNQIRAQLALDGHVLINDFKYGFNPENKEKDYVPLGLYCVKLSFSHPVTKEKLSFMMNKDLFKFNKYIDLEKIYEKW